MKCQLRSHLQSVETLRAVSRQVLDWFNEFSLGRQQTKAPSYHIQLLVSTCLVQATSFNFDFVNGSPYPKGSSP